MADGGEKENPITEFTDEFAKEFAKCFGNSYTYGKDAKDWPRVTIVVAMLTEIGNEEKPETCVFKNSASKHVELVLINYLKDKLEKDLKERGKEIKPEYNLKIYISYSPCSERSDETTKKECSKKLIELKESHKIIRKIQIKFSTFYHFYENKPNVNSDGLKNLLRCDGISLETLGGDDWEPFLCNVLQPKFEIPDVEIEKLLKAIKTPERKTREDRDSIIMFKLKGEAEEDDLSNKFADVDIKEEKSSKK